MIHTEYHRHKGVESNGKLKSHAVTVTHKSSIANTYHNKEIGVITEKTVKKTIKNPSNIDEQGYIMIDLTSAPKEVKGIKIKFQRTENNKKRTIGLQIEK